MGKTTAHSYTVGRTEWVNVGKHPVTVPSAGTASSVTVSRAGPHPSQAHQDRRVHHHSLCHPVPWHLLLG